MTCKVFRVVPLVVRDLCAANLGVRKQIRNLYSPFRRLANDNGNVTRYLLTDTSSGPNVQNSVHFALFKRSVVQLVLGQLGQEAGIKV